jgi:lipid-A-disaccharide synthase
MQAAGVELLSGFSSAFGVAELFFSLSALRLTFRKACDALTTQHPSVLVLIDYPDFNLRLAAEARKLGIRVLYYVSPQVWAWREKRVHKIAALVDRMAVILPFEEKIYREAGLPCEFVGHPVMDEIRSLRSDKQAIRQELGLFADRPVLSLLPGSRPHELQRLLPLMLDTLYAFRKRYSGYQFCMPFAPNTDMRRHQEIIGRLQAEGVSITRGESLKVLSVSDLAVIASGTASLQAALLGVPHVVVYKLFPLTYWLARRIVKVRHISLVNILSDSGVVKEFVQDDASAANVMEEVARLMSPDYRSQMLSAFAGVTAVFADKQASRRVAEIVLEMGGWR